VTVADRHCAKWRKEIEMVKFNGGVTLREFKKSAVQLEVLGAVQDAEWRVALERVRSWKAARSVLPFAHPMLAVAAGEEA